MNGRVSGGRPEAMEYPLRKMFRRCVNVGKRLNRYFSLKSKGHKKQAVFRKVGRLTELTTEGR